MTGTITWTSDMIDQLRTLWSEGHSTAEIGRQMGVSKNAVCGKVGRLDLPPRPSPIGRDGRRVPLAPRKTVRIAAARAATAAPVVPVPVVVPRPSGLACQWLTGQRHSYRFCGEPVVRGSYCAEHGARAYIASSPPALPSASAGNRHAAFARTHEGQNQ